MTGLPLSVLQGLLHPEDYRSPEDYHNPEDLKKIATLEASIKKLSSKLEELVKCNTSEKVTGKKSRKSIKKELTNINKEKEIK